MYNLTVFNKIDVLQNFFSQISREEQCLILKFYIYLDERIFFIILINKKHSL